MEEFLNNEDIDVRRSIMSKLSLNDEHYSKEHRSSIRKALEIARNHEDEYIRHRLNWSWAM